jgi:predicted TPR repeat methyltransferase
MKDVFAKAAGYYGYRTPYPAAFFDLMADRCAISTNSRIIDLCTGRGEVALGLADRADSVLAVDSSSEMFRLATPHEHIKYLAADVNAPEFIQGLAGHRATHITVGRAMHWIGERVLSDLAAHALARMANWSRSRAALRATTRGGPPTTISAPGSASIQSPQIPWISAR